MNNRRFFIGIFVASFALVALLVWFAKQRPAEMVSPASAETNPASPSTEPVPGDPKQASTPSPAEEGPLATSGGMRTNVAMPPGQSKAERMLNLLSNYNDTPIVYCGKLEDQFGQPVASAAVDFSVRVNNGYESTTQRGRVISDAGGRFTISGYTGADLRIVPQKAGYAIASTNRWANYSRLFPEGEPGHPDPSDPGIIKMWKLQGAEPLLGIDQHYDLRFTGEPICFDLLAGKIVSSGGDIKMTVSQALGEGALTNQEIWNVRVEAVRGGLMDSAGLGRTTYWAPTDGYQSAENLMFPTNVAGVNRSFFVVSRNGQIYSKLGVSFRINDGAAGLMYVGFTGVANTNGSRNWEGDPNTYKPQ